MSNMNISPKNKTSIKQFLTEIRKLLFPMISDFTYITFKKENKKEEKKWLMGQYVTREEIDEGLRRCAYYAKKYND